MLKRCLFSSLFSKLIFVSEGDKIVNNLLDLWQEINKIGKSSHKIMNAFAGIRNLFIILKIFFKDTGYFTAVSSFGVLPIDFAFSYFLFLFLFPI